jgi:hypothetical protein
LRDEQHSVTAGITRKVKATGSSSVPSLARWGHELFSGRVIQPRSLCQMARFHLGAFWEAYGLGLARDSLDGHTTWVVKCPFGHCPDR